MCAVIVVVVVVVEPMWASSQIQARRLIQRRQQLRCSCIIALDAHNEIVRIQVSLSRRASERAGAAALDMSPFAFGGGFVNQQQCIRRRQHPLADCAMIYDVCPVKPAPENSPLGQHSTEVVVVE